MKIRVNKCNKNENCICNANSNIQGNKNEKMIKTPELNTIKNIKFELYSKNYNPNINFFIF